MSSLPFMQSDGTLAQVRNTANHVYIDTCLKKGLTGAGRGDDRQDCVPGWQP